MGFIKATAASQDCTLRPSIPSTIPRYEFPRAFIARNSNPG